MNSPTLENLRKRWKARTFSRCGAIATLQIGQLQITRQSSTQRDGGKFYPEFHPRYGLSLNDLQAIVDACAKVGIVPREAMTGKEAP